MKSPESSSCEYLDNWRDVQLHVTRQIIKIIRLDNASVNSTCAQPPPPGGYCGVFARLVSPGGGAFAKFALPGGRATFLGYWIKFLLILFEEHPLLL